MSLFKMTYPYPIDSTDSRIGHAEPGEEREFDADPETGFPDANFWAPVTAAKAKKRQRQKPDPTGSATGADAQTQPSTDAGTVPGTQTDQSAVADEPKE